jgi:hypothetical protein
MQPRHVTSRECRICLEAAALPRLVRLLAALVLIVPSGKASNPRAATTG